MVNLPRGRLGGRGGEKDTRAPATLNPGCCLLLLSLSFPGGGGARLYLETQMEPVRFSMDTESVLLQKGKLRKAQVLASQGPLHSEG